MPREPSDHRPRASSERRRDEAKPSVSSFLRQHREAIVRAWEARVTSEPRAIGLAGVALRDDVPVLLDELAAWMASDADPDTSALATQALEHVMRRLQEGLALAQVLREYRLLRETILEKVLEAKAAEQDRPEAAGTGARLAQVGELARLNAGLDVVLSQSIAQLVEERDRRAALERRRAEEALRASEARLATELEAARRLQETSSQLIREENVEALYDALLAAAVGVMHSDCGSIQRLHPGRGPSGELQLIGHRGFSPAAAAFWEWVRPDSASTCGIALRTRQRVVVPDVRTAELMAGSGDQQAYLETGILAVQTTPLVSRAGRMLGMISTHWCRPHQPPEHDLALLDVLARQAADLIERTQAEESLREREQSLREADRHKNEFMAALSHELRNPLAPIRNSLFILERATPGGEQARRAQAVVARQVAQLSRLVDDLLEVTRISRNKTQLQRQRLELNELTRRTAEDQRSLFDEGGVRLEARFAPRGVFVSADWERLSQVVGNLLQNAAKFTPRGGSVTLSVESDTASGCAVLRVADTGVGMQPETLAHLFQPFMQADKTLDRSKGGLGLGLALVKGLVELHGGEVSASSDGPGKGSLFTIRLPLAEEAALEPPPQSIAPCRGRRVLIIEDNVDAAGSLREVLLLGEHEVAVAYDGPEGLAVARTFRPEVVLCDIGLPGMSGYDVAQAFRADAALAGTYLVALSGYALPEDQQRATEAGFDEHLAKPPSFDRLEAVLANRSGRPRRSAASG